MSSGGPIRFSLPPHAYSRADDAACLAIPRSSHVLKGGAAQDTLLGQKGKDTASACEVEKSI